MVVWDARKHASELSGASLGKIPSSAFFHHILPKSKFPEAAFFIQEKVALEVTNEVDFLDAYTHFKKTEKEVKKKCDFIIETSKGASQKIIDRIFN